jgi:hypothetical protein
MKLLLCAVALAAMATAVPANADPKIKIDTLPAEYTPYLSSLHEPVSMRSFHFEISEETGRARIVAQYTYPDTMTAGAYDPGGPRPAVVQIPGLSYDAKDHTVVYDSDGKRTVCAVVKESRNFWSHGTSVKSTGACTVATESGNVTVDDGWDIHHVQVLNTYFEVH